MDIYFEMKTNLPDLQSTFQTKHASSYITCFEITFLDLSYFLKPDPVTFLINDNILVNMHCTGR